MKFKDENLFLNYLGMAYQTYEEPKSLMFPHLQSAGL